MKSTARIIYIAVIAMILLIPQISAPIALLAGLVFAFSMPHPCPKFNKKTSKYLLQVAVVCL
ncbi:MAG: putative sulfate exporter family transporter, partial [Muribaculaceae bacterium]|nr:putative sulfate exporter family transporter [Muribaculaceae bacterium]